MKSRLVRLMSAAPNKPEVKMLSHRTSYMWDQAYRAIISHYFRVAAKRKTEAYQRWAVYTVME